MSVPSKSLFGNNVEPSCSYCRYNRAPMGRQTILCERFGPVTGEYSCRHFSYDPILRQPKRQPQLPDFSPEDFSI